MGGRHRAPGADEVAPTHPGTDPAPPPEPLPGPGPLPRRREVREQGHRAGPPRRHRHRPAPRRRPRVVPLVVPVLLVVVLALAAVRLADRGEVVPASTGPAAVSASGSAASPAGGADGSSAGAPSAVRAVQAVLDERAAALLRRDRDGWLAAVGDDASVTAPALAALAGYRERTAAAYDRLQPVPLGTWGWEVTGSAAPLAGERAQQLPVGSWVVRATLVWSLEGAGDDPVRRQQDLTVVPRGTGWAVVDDADGETVPDLWDLGDVAVVGSERAVVLGTADRSQLDRAAEVATDAAERVDAVWGTGWPRRTVVEVPADQGQMAALLGRDDDAGLDQIAAVTTGELVGGDGATRGDHVVVNPTGFGQLAPLGQRVVMTHELTHVATRSGAVRAVPLWLSEGFADWVGYRGTGLSRQVVAADLLVRVRAGGVPDRLPTAAQFDPAANGDIGPSYSGAWLAVDGLARRHGDDAVVDLYRAASRDPLPEAGTAAAPGADGADGSSGGTGDGSSGGSSDDGGGGEADAAVEAALAAVVGTDVDAVVADWRADLAELARAEGP